MQRNTITEVRSVESSQTNVPDSPVFRRNDVNIAEMRLLSEINHFEENIYDLSRELGRTNPFCYKDRHLGIIKEIRDLLDLVSLLLEDIK